MRTLFNLGCGSRIHAAWRNLDLHGRPPEVEAWRVEEGLPCADGEATMCYASHLLEHLAPETAGEFIRDCHRALEPGGILRLVVPDLETICRRYLAAVERGIAVTPAGEHEDYDWAVLELLDQLVRTRSGGRVLEWVGKAGLEGRALMMERWGEEARGLLAYADGLKEGGKSSRGGWRAMLRSFRARLAGWLAGVDAETLELARFRASGEAHQWMYDQHSLGRLLRSRGFIEVRVCQAQEGGLPGWAEYQLDADLSGKTHKPDSLFMEGVKPGG